MKRLVLVDRRSNRVCGDTAASGLFAPIWTTIADRDENIAGLAASAVRLLDESLGRTVRDYIFTPFASDQDSDGYLIFDCSGCKDAPAPPIASETPEPDETIYSIMTSCFYVGYIRRDH
ncbi:hypothetical protein [Methylocystis sp. B8]|uniref:hypothetical protein n=1 Tax=Methylocystis sp. B8 TaxID=544938 RepID=UPI0010FD37DF|nr:hypothetical protein [Methylocystis sp. B8]TLG79319.1 hypothetical protein FEV16_04785 [Methylocystis sp. B8]